jgi:6-phosphogluconolactonase
MTPDRIIAADDAEQVAHIAAERLLIRVRHAQGRAAVCLTGGSSPQRLYKLLATASYRDALPWDRIHWFIGDERFVAQGDPLSNMGAARRTFLDGLTPPQNIHPIDTLQATPNSAAQHYERELKRFYGSDTLDLERPLFDLVLMGLGDDGHTASLFPGAPGLSEQTRWVIGVDQAALQPFVPRVTLTFPTLASTREMLFLVDNPSKRNVLTRLLDGEELPAGRAYSNGELAWLVTRSALPETADPRRA